MLELSRAKPSRRNSHVHTNHPMNVFISLFPPLLLAVLPALIGLNNPVALDAGDDVDQEDGEHEREEPTSVRVKRRQSSKPEPRLHTHR
jgi:hypothetical protein